ncbi:hypothetical protein QBC39DRAFT_138782 [Podospora conica]|nr:hypothetical protein QBC39DRAFT_138782 [Schizothecium conicum]
MDQQGGSGRHRTTAWIIKILVLRSPSSFRAQLEHVSENTSPLIPHDSPLAVTRQILSSRGEKQHSASPPRRRNLATPSPTLRHPTSRRQPPRRSLPMPSSLQPPKYHRTMDLTGRVRGTPIAGLAPGRITIQRRYGAWGLATVASVASSNVSPGAPVTATKGGPVAEVTGRGGGDRGIFDFIGYLGASSIGTESFLSSGRDFSDIWSGRYAAESDAL